MSKTILRFFAGEVMQFDVAVIRGGAPINLTGAKVYCTIKHDANQTDAQAIVQYSTDDGYVQILDPASEGTVRVTIPSQATSGFTKTRILAYDVRVIEADGRPSVVDYGWLFVERGPTEAIQ